jgi:hypothetical protein
VRDSGASFGHPLAKAFYAAIVRGAAASAFEDFTCAEQLSAFVSCPSEATPSRYETAGIDFIIFHDPFDCACSSTDSSRRGREISG